MIDKIFSGETIKLETHFQNSAADRLGGGGAATVGGTLSYGQGLNGLAATFSSNYVNYANIAKLMDYIGSTTPFSVRVKAKATGSSSVHRMFFADNNNSGTGYSLLMRQVVSSAYFGAGWGTGTNVNSSSNTSVINDGVWRYYELQYTGSNLRLIQNGALTSLANLASIDRTGLTGHKFAIGRNGAYTSLLNYFVGTMDSFVIVSGGEKSQKTHNANLFRRKG